VASADEVRAGKAKVVKPDGHQIALFRTEDGELHAVDNRCPHEGYPLAEGVVRDGVLTCEWHNWKFRLCDGVCTVGGEDVRHYPVRVEGGEVFVDLTPQARGDQVPALHRSIERAIDEEDWGQLSRDVQRLLVAGRTPEQVLSFACAWTADHSKYGFDHGLATAADIARAFEDFEGEEVDLPLTQAVTLAVETHVRRPPRVWPDPEPPPAGVEIEAELRRRIEQEDQRGAEALVRGAIEAGTDPDELFRWLTHAATDHFYDFGHSHIYAVKAEELVGRVGWEHAHPILTSLVTDMIYATREDRLPYMRKYARAMEAHAASLARWAAADPEPSATLDDESFAGAVLDGTLEDALGAVAHALDRHVAPERIAGRLGIAAARRILRFDPAIDADDAGTEGWLWVTHGLTHADAVRESLVRRPPTPETLRGLFLSARFVQHTRPLDAAQPEPAPTAALEGRELRRAVVGDLASRPIFLAHVIKTPFAAQRLADATGSREPLVAAARLLSGRLQERRVFRRAKIARELVRRGKMHRKLLGY